MTIGMIIGSAVAGRRAQVLEQEVRQQLTAIATPRREEQISELLAQLEIHGVAGDRREGLPIDRLRRGCRHDPAQDAASMFGLAEQPLEDGVMRGRVVEVIGAPA